MRTDSRPHTHECRRKGCKNTIECNGTYTENYDGWPAAVCDEFHERENNVCQECQDKDEAERLADEAEP